MGIRTTWCHDKTATPGRWRGSRRVSGRRLFGDIGQAFETGEEVVVAVVLGAGTIASGVGVAGTAGIDFGLLGGVPLLIAASAAVLGIAAYHYSQ